MNEAKAGLELFYVQTATGRKQITEAEFKALNPMPPAITNSHAVDVRAEIEARSAASPEFAAGIESAKAQHFFQGLFKQTQSPGTGDHYRQFVKNLLLRAQEAGLFNPEIP